MNPCPLLNPNLYTNDSIVGAISNNGSFSPIARSGSNFILFIGLTSRPFAIISGSSTVPGYLRTVELFA